MLPLLSILSALCTIFFIVVFTSIYHTTIYDSNIGRGPRKRKLFEEVQELSTVEEEDSELDDSSLSDDSESVIDMLHRSIVNTKVDSSNNLRHSCVDVDVNEEVLNEDDETDEGCEVCECRSDNMEMETTSAKMPLENSLTAAIDNDDSSFVKNDILNGVKDSSEYADVSNSPKVFIALRKEPEYKSFNPSS